MRLVLPLVLLLCLGSSAYAQGAFKCQVNGRQVIQESPCKVQGPMATEGSAGSEATGHAAALCESALRQAMKDPAAAMVSGIRRGRTGEWCNPDIQVRYYWAIVNGKNSYGGYVGEKPYRCALDMAETKVLKVSQIGEHEKIIPCR